MPRFLVIGAGLMAQPAVEYLSRKECNFITVAGYTLEEAQILANKFSSVKTIQIDAASKKELNQIIGDFDVVVSLVPAHFHSLIAEVCIYLKVNMVTASYQPKEMLALATKAKQAGICIMNEIGLDPGIDHLAAMEIIDKAHENNDEVESFVSWCGGLPAPESNDNPLGYKFSWEPRGAIMVLRNNATYQHDYNIVNVKGEDLMGWATPIEITGLKLECYPNRESTNYKNIYGIENVKDILRGTLRYQGFCQVFQAIKDLGLMNTNEQQIPSNITWKDFVLSLNGVDGLSELKPNFSSKAWDAITWLGCFSDELIVTEKDSSIDALCVLLLQKLSYKADEKDMVVLQHKFIIKHADGSRKYISSVLKVIGDPQGYSAMAKTVGYPIAIAAQLIAENKIESKGLVLPVTKEIYQPMLESLMQEGIVFDETVLSDNKMSVEKFLAEVVCSN